MNYNLLLKRYPSISLIRNIWIFEKQIVLDDRIGPSLGTPPLQFPWVMECWICIRPHPNEWSVGFLLELTTNEWSVGFLLELTTNEWSVGFLLDLTTNEWSVGFLYYISLELSPHPFSLKKLKKKFQNPP
jgi:hypothetical protein